MIVIYQHPRCRAAKKCIKILETDCNQINEISHHGLDVTENELRRIISILGCKPIDLIKLGHTIYKTLLQFLDLNDDELIKIMLHYPVIIKSPIVINGNKAVIGRPPELIKQII
ncbi:ArsC/Spx/MgsR family protein [Neotamlana laminarinivorans]|uniref:Arsenate reductase n=1 Tax=Neotamlana laminarinivorans TaxID=2883124 RepID=A0A9X1L0A9_9FLAO|nr:ArsC/Spx/MgsR family protein [Tamlana laminarinivorans]MCB4797608.1 arsenate reductase [Tamlana laminarinivorans]